MDFPRIRDDYDLGSDLLNDPILARYYNRDKEAIQKAIIYASTLDLPPSITIIPEFSEFIEKRFEQVDRDWFKTATASFKRGIGSAYVNFGMALKYLGIAEKFADDIIREGRQIQFAYAPKYRRNEFQFSDILDPDWWATSVAENVPMFLSLLPAALVTAYGLGTAGALAGLGLFGKTILSAVGGGLVMRGVDAALEAGQTYEEMLGRGMREEVARKRANETFEKNMLFVSGLDMLQFGLLFTPLNRVPGIKNIIQSRRLAIGTKFGGGLVTEAVEEAVQDLIQQAAAGEEVRWRPATTEAMMIGGIFGLGMGGVGSVYGAIVERSIKKMPTPMLESFTENVAANLIAGEDGNTAILNALDKVAETPEGKKLFEDVGKELKDAVEGKVVEEVVEPARKVEAREEKVLGEKIEPVAEKPIELPVKEQDVLDVIEGKTTYEDVFGKIDKEELVPKKLSAREMLKKDKVLGETLKILKDFNQEIKKIESKEDRRRAIENALGAINDLLLKARIRADVEGFRSGLKFGSVLTNKYLTLMFREETQAMNEARKNMVKYIREHLPADVRGRYLNAVIEKLTDRKQAKIYERVAKDLEKIEFKEYLDIIEDFKTTDYNISVKYKKMIKALVEDISTKNITEKTVRRLEGLKNYIDDYGIPNDISTHDIRELEELSKKRPKDFTLDELRKLTEQLEKLKALGKLEKQLLDAQQQREIDKWLDRLSKTRNFDVKIEEDDFGFWKRGLQSLYMDTLQPPRVFDSMDGFMNYQGPNAQLEKRIAIKESRANLLFRTEMSSAIEEMIDNGITEITPEENVRIMINIRALEGAYDQVNTLKRYYEYDDIPVLTPKETKVIEILEKYSNKYIDEYAKVYESTTGKIFPKIERYIVPIFYKKEIYRYNPEEVVSFRGRATRATGKERAIERKEFVDKLPDVDVLSVFERGLSGIIWYMMMEPELHFVKNIVLSERYFDIAGATNQKYWKEYIDIVARKGEASTYEHTPFTNLLKRLRGNLTKAVLGYKLSSILMQPFAIFDAMSYSVSRFGVLTALDIMAEVTKCFVNPKYAKKIIAESPMLQTRQAGEVSIEELYNEIGRSESSTDKFIKGGLSLLRKADILTAAGVQNAFEKILKRNGVPHAKPEAEFLMNLVSSSSEVTFRPLILSKGEGRKTLFTFKTFFLNRWGLIAHDLITSGLIQGDWKAKYGALLGLGIMVLAKIAEDEAREFIYETITKKELNTNRSLAWRVMFAIPSNIPFFGEAFEMMGYRRSITDFPLGRSLDSLFRVAGIFEAKKEETAIRRLLGGVEAFLSLYKGIPGTAQAFDILEGVLISGKEKPKGGIRIKPIRPVTKRIMQFEEEED